MTTPAAPQPTAPVPAGPPAPAPADPAAPPAQTFTQEDVDRIVAGRVARENKGLEEIKAKAARLDEIEAQNASELEKATKKAADDARAETLTAVNKHLVRAKVEAVAATAQFHDPADAAALLAARFGEVTVDDGEVDGAAVQALVQQLAKDKPHLVRSGTPQRLPGQGTPPAESNTGSVSAGADLYRQRKQKT